MARVDNLTNFLNDVASAIKTKKEYESSQKIPAANFDTEIATIETGIDTSDATATADDIISPKTAYADGQKITGGIIPEYVANDVTRKSFTTGSTYTFQDIIPMKNVALLSDSSGLYIADVDGSVISYNNMMTLSLDTLGIPGYTTIDDAKFSLEESDELYVYYVVRQPNSWNWRMGSVRVNINTSTIIESATVVSYNHGNSADEQYTGKACLVPNPKYINQFAVVFSNREGYGMQEGYIHMYYLSVVSGTITTLHDSHVRVLFVKGTMIASQGYFSGNGEYFVGKININGTKSFKTLRIISSSSCSVFSTSELQLIGDDYAIIGTNLYHLPDTSTVVGTVLSGLSEQYYARSLGNKFYYESGTTCYRYNFDGITLTQDDTFTIQSNARMYSSQNSFMFAKTSNTTINGDYVGGKTLYSLETSTAKLYDTSSGDATASEVLASKKAFNSTGKITGTMPNNGTLNYTPTTSSQAIPAGYTSGGTISAVTSAIDNNIIAENIKNGINILGVTGTYTGDSNIKLFSTIEEMNNDPNIELGDLAVVYESSIGSVTADSIFDKCTFPSTVVLDTAVSDYVYIDFRTVTTNRYIMEVSLSPTSFNAYISTESMWLEIRYTSSDGITYTRTDSGEDTIEFGVDIQCFDPSRWNDALGYFIKIASGLFSGLYKAVQVSDDVVYQLALTQLDAKPEYVFNKTFYGANGAQQGQAHITTDLDLNALKQRMNMYDTLSHLTTNITNLAEAFANTSYDNIPMLNTFNVTNMYNMFYNCVNLTNVSEINMSNVTNITNMFYNCNNLSTISYANITNMLPLASNITNRTIMNIGLNISNFTVEQRGILANKGYVDAEEMTGNYSNQYIIEYT